MKVLIKKPFIQASTKTCFIIGKEYEVAEEFGKSVCKAGLAIEVAEEKKPTKKKKVVKNEA